MDAGDGSGVLRMVGQEREEVGGRNAMVVATNHGAMTAAREYRRGNWTLPETMLLIEAKKRVHGDRHPADQGLARWRWVEDYCWRAGCRRSQNQCNDRWDNLMRDYKKVRAYELAGGAASYWAMERAERKERCLPANLLREIYDAITEVLERRMSGGAPVFLGASPSSSSLLHVPMLQACPLAHVLPPPLEPETTAANCSSVSPERKRCRRLTLDGQPGGSSAPATAGHGDGADDHGHDDDDDEGLGRAIGRCAEILSDALEGRDAAEERRHRESLAAGERLGRARQARRDTGEQCVAGLAAAVNQLAGSMLALAAKRKQGPAAPK